MTDQQIVIVGLHDTNMTSHIKSLLSEHSFDVILVDTISEVDDNINPENIIVANPLNKIAIIEDQSSFNLKKLLQSDIQQNKMHRELLKDDNSWRNGSRGKSGKIKYRRS